MPKKAKNQDSKSKWCSEKSSGRYETEEKEAKHHHEKKEEKTMWILLQIILVNITLFSFQ